MASSVRRTVSQIQKRVDFRVSPPPREAIPSIVTLNLAGKSPPDLELRVGKSRLTGRAKRVADPKKFRGKLKNGDVFLYFHVYSDSRNPREVSALLRALHEKLPEIKAAGYAGLVGDTYRPSIANFFRVRGASVWRTPVSEQLQLKLRAYFFDQGMRHFGKSWTRLIIK